MAFSSMQQSRPFPKLSSATSPSLNGSNTSSAMKSTLGNGSGPWGSRTASIWGSAQVPNTLAARTATADKAHGSRSVIVNSTNDSTTKKGSGSLLASSESDTWSLQQSRSALPPHSSLAHSVDRSRSCQSSTSSISPTVTRPPAVNLTHPSFPHGRSTFSPPHLTTTFGTEAPTVYPKNKDRANPGTYTPADSVIDYTSAATSPASERRPQWPPHYSNPTSVATSRDVSRAPHTRRTERQYSLSNSDSSALIPHYALNNYSSHVSSSRADPLSPIGTSTDFTASFHGLSLHDADRPSSSRSLPPGTRIIQDEHPSHAEQTLLSNIDQFLPTQSHYAQSFSSASFGTNSVPPQVLSLGFPAYDRQLVDHAGQYLAFAASQTTNQNFRQQTAWQEADSTVTAIPRRSAHPQDQRLLLDPRFAAHVSGLKSPYNVSGGFGAVTPVSVNPLQSFTPYYPTGLGGVPTSLPTAEIEQGLQSAKLFDFKMAGKNTRRYELRDIYEHIAEFAGDQHGSRFIQTKLETANSDEKERVFREIEPNAIPLMTDVFGNYVIQKFFDHGHQEHKRILANKMRGQVLALSTQMYGCRVVQKALEHVLLEQQVALVNELKHHVLKCVKDQNGNHVIQKVIERCSTDSISFVYEAFIGQAHSLSLHPYGCRVIQRCLERSEWFPAKPAILAELHEGVPKGMVGDSYGNYVVQHIVQNGPDDERRHVLGIVLADVESFSKHKFASNVVEKCIEYSDDNWRRQVVDIFTKTDHRRPEHESILVGLIKDQYGNYVIQRLLDRLLMPDYIQFHHQLQPAMTHAKRTGSGKQVVSIEKKMQRFDFMPIQHDVNQPIMAPPILFNGQYTPSNGTAATPTTSSSSLLYNGHASAGMSTPLTGDTVEGATSMSRKNSEAFDAHATSQP